jgi:hypothetical protein|tara:strand:+ start:360 stop:605 length:246 start_codon:yes stop_codon:yes gene_type:complete
MSTSIVWNYEDIDSNLLAVEYNEEPIGYFRIDKNDFVVMTEHNHNYPSISIEILGKIVNGYDDALKIAQKIKNKGESCESE